MNQTSIHINGAGRYENAEIEYVVFVLRCSAGEIDKAEFEEKRRIITEA